LSCLRPISSDEYAAWLETVIPAYAQDKVASGQWPADSALERSRKEYSELLPQGPRTAGHHVYTILGGEGEAVGTLWFAAQERAGQRIAYVFDVVIAAEHRRRGYALLAFRALEDEAVRLGLDGIALHVFGHNHAARALYAKLGFADTNVNMFKGLPASADSPPAASRA
jgi:RimJ/RimL family protein N-acetyltransferase